MKQSSRITLTNLIRKCSSGDQTAWHELIDLIAPLIFSICHKSRLSRDESFDIYGQVCLELLKSIDSISDPKKIYSFVSTITRRQIYAYYNSLRFNEFIENKDVLDDGSDGITAESFYLRIKNRELLSEALESLPIKESKLLKLLFLDRRGLTYREISKYLNIPESSIGPTRSRALEKLYRKLKGKMKPI